jgi:GNAT superfamily N-acetyltransferase
MDWRLRLAGEDYIPALEALIPISVRALQAMHYSSAQMEAALGTVFGVDRQLICDGTYFVVERDGQIVGCGGWSKRNSLFGGDSGRSNEDVMLNPARDSARIRAFFVHPESARRGIGRGILTACESAIQAAGFTLPVQMDVIVSLTASSRPDTKFSRRVVGRCAVREPLPFWQRVRALGGINRGAIPCLSSDELSFLT